MSYLKSGGCVEGNSVTEPVLKLGQVKEDELSKRKRLKYERQEREFHKQYGNERPVSECYDTPICHRIRSFQGYDTCLRFYSPTRRWEHGYCPVKDKGC